MKIEIKSRVINDVSGFPNEVILETESPKVCPHCGVSVALRPDGSFAFGYEDGYSFTIYSVFVCENCNSPFIGVYQAKDFSPHYISDTGYLDCTYPSQTSFERFPEAIQEISPSFVRIYSQALTAEEQGLTDICGMGYRKALEFLVKDFAISLHPEESDSISSMKLGRCINEKLDDPTLQTLTKAASWIGNDETHYVRKHEDMNVDKLKKFIKVAVSSIDSYLTYQEASNFINR